MAAEIESRRFAGKDSPFMEVRRGAIKSRGFQATRILRSVEETITTAEPPSDDRRRHIGRLPSVTRSASEWE